MIQLTKQEAEPEKEPGRNDPCSCGSGKKYKKCCLPKKEFLDNKADVTTMLKLLYCFTKGLKGQSILITKRTLDTMPADWVEKLSIQPMFVNELETYKVSVVQEKKSLIETPNKRIIV